MAITALPNPPSRSDPANFPERADAFMAALPIFAQEANLLQDQVNEAAEAADENARAAGSSAQDAASSRTQADQKAAEAAAAALAAGQRETEAANSAALAAEWAAKTGAPVSGGEFSAKHYAQLAAQGMGLPVFGSYDVPTTNVGPIYISGQGAAEWDTFAGAYRVKVDVGFAIVYPNGGSEEAPAPVAVNTRYVMSNPFPDAFVMCEAQLRYSDGWASTGWFTMTNSSYGTRASQLDHGSIVVRTGTSSVTPSPDGGGISTNGSLLGPVQCRVLVWRVKG